MPLRRSLPLPGATRAQAPARPRPCRAARRATAAHDRRGPSAAEDPAQGHQPRGTPGEDGLACPLQKIVISPVDPEAGGHGLKDRRRPGARSIQPPHPRPALHDHHLSVRTRFRESRSVKGRPSRAPRRSPHHRISAGGARRHGGLLHQIPRRERSRNGASAMCVCSGSGGMAITPLSGLGRPRTRGPGQPLVGRRGDVRVLDLRDLRPWRPGSRPVGGSAARLRAGC